MQNVFSEELRADERILWQGQPDPKILFTKMDILMVPFSLVWGGFAIAWEVGVLYAMEKAEPPAKAIGILGPIFGIPFVLIGLYFIFGRFIVKRMRKKKTWYAVTNQRVLILSKFMGHRLDSVDLKSIGSVSKSIRSNGSGTLIFGNSPAFLGMYANTGLEFFTAAYGSHAPAFYDIKEAERVYKIVKNGEESSI